MRIRRRTLPAFVLALASFAFAVHAERSVRLYRPQSRDAAELVGPAQAALGDEGSATLDPGTNAVVLVGEPRVVEAALRLLAELDRPARTVVLHYESQRLEDLEARGVRVAWSIDAGSVRIGNVVAPPGVDLVAIRPFAGSGERSSRLAGVLRVQDGQSGRIETGTSVPYLQHVSPWESQVGYASAASGFEATPRVQGDGRVRVGLLPFEGELGRGGGGHAPGAAIHSRGAATDVTVKPGEVVAVGSLERSHEQSARGLGGVAAERRYEEWVLLLRVEAEGAPPPPAPE
jgi:type II secretory pathway component HofQ